MELEMDTQAPILDGGETPCPHLHLSGNAYVAWSRKIWPVTLTAIWPDGLSPILVGDGHFLRRIMDMSRSLAVLRDRKAY